MRSTTRALALAALTITALAAPAVAQPAAQPAPPEVKPIAPPGAPAAGSGNGIMMRVPAEGSGAASGSGAGAAVAPTEPGPPPPTDGKAACVALARQDVDWFRGQCTQTIDDALAILPTVENKPPMGTGPDPTVAFVNKLTEQMWPLIKRYKAEDLEAAAAASHERTAKAIGKDQRHVILAYAAMWLLSAGFLIYLWRRQLGLKAQIAELKRDLEAAVKDGK